MLWHPSLPASTASETLPGNPGGGGGIPSAPSSTRLLLLAPNPMGTRSSPESSLVSDGVTSSPCDASPSLLDASPLQDAPGMPRPPPPPVHRGGLRWRRASWRGAAAARRKRGSVVQQQPQQQQRGSGGRRSWSGRGIGRGSAEPWTPLARASPSGKIGMATRRAVNANALEAATESLVMEDSQSSVQEEAVSMEITTRVGKDEERVEDCEMEEDSSAQKETAAEGGSQEEEGEEEGGEEEEERDEEEEEEKGDRRELRGKGRRKEDAAAPAVKKSTVEATTDHDSGLIGAKKRKSNKVVKREVEPRVEHVEEIATGSASEAASEEKPSEEQKDDVHPQNRQEVPDEEDKTSQDEGRGQETGQVQRSDEEDMRYVCPICEDVLSSQHLFTVHIRSHNDVRTTSSSDPSATNASGASSSANGLKAFSCRICGKALSSSSSLDRHMLVHSGERPFKCRLCGVAFTTNGNMHRHMRTHTANSSAATKDPEEVSDCGSSDSGGSKKSKATPKKCRTSTPATTPSPGSGRKRQANGSSADTAKYGRGGGGSPRGGSRNSREVSAGTAGSATSPASDIGWRCLTCDISFRNQRALRLHAYMAHRDLEPDEEEEEEDYEDEDYEEEERGAVRKKTRRNGDRDVEGGNGGERNSSRSIQAPTLGFQDLTFVDFSTQKFPLIARAACEKAVHRASSEYHRFHCGRCDRAFPCGSALHIHADSRHRSSSSSPTAAAPPSADDPKEDFFAVLNLKNSTRCGSSPPPSSSALPPPHLRLFPHSNSPSLSHLPYAERKRREEEFDNAFYFNSPAMKPKDLYGSGKKSAGNDEDNGREASEAPKDLADINSMMAVAGNGSGLMRSMEEDEEYDEMDGGGGYEEEEEEQEEEDATFAAELREMKLRGEFPCKLCPSVFPNLRALKGHSRNHISEIVEEASGEEDGVHKYPCCLCGRRIASDKHGLMRHLRSHNGERPFRCALCRYAFTTKANCERHLRNRHSKASREEIRRSVIYSPVADESHLNAEAEEKGISRPDVMYSSSPRHCPPATGSPVPTKLSALLTAISDAKNNLPPSDAFDRNMERADDKTKFHDRDGSLRTKESGHMDDLSSVEALVNFAKSPSLPAPLAMMSGQLPLHQHLFRPIAVKKEHVKENVAASAEVPLDLSMDALDLSSKKVQDEPEDLSRPTVDKPRSNPPSNPVPLGVGYNEGLLMPVRLPATTSRPVLPLAPSVSPQSSQPLKRDHSSVPLPNGASRVEMPMATPPASSFYPNPLQMYINSQFPSASSTPSARPPVGNFPYLLPLPFPSTSAPLIPQLQSTPIQAPTMHPPSLLSPAVSQPLPSHSMTPSYTTQAIPTTTAPPPPSMERLEKEILRNLHLTSGGSLVLDAASVADRIQAIALAAAAAAGFPPATTTEHLPKPVVTQAKENKSNEQVISVMRDSTPTKEESRMQPGVKMVIKNGVLMPKQKQRRYRTERPFACCHCSARFTLRSNMERHIKQQHPEFWSQRPRGGRRGGSSGLSGGPSSRTDASTPDARLSNSPDGPLPLSASLPSESAGKPSSEDGCTDDYRGDDEHLDDGDSNNRHSLPDDRMSTPESSTNLDDPNNIKAKDNSNKIVISEEVKNAIAQQLKSKLIADCRPVINPLFGGTEEARRKDAKEEVKKTVKDENNEGDEEDSGELVIDEEKMDAMENDCGMEKGVNNNNSGCPETKEDESSGVDLASVSKLLDNASTQTFQQYFKTQEDEEMEDVERRGSVRRGGDEGYDGGDDGEDEEEEEEEEGWKSGDESVGGSKCGASSSSSGEEGSVRGGHNHRTRSDDRDDSLERKLASVTVEAATAADTEDKGKRRSAYSSAPNRVSCPYCMRKFPWRSSLRRHILTHTGQKPYKCAHCPLLFTTKSNCDRHLLRKHGRGNGSSGSTGGGCGGSSSGAEDAASLVSSTGSGLSPGGGAGGGAVGGGSAASGAYTMRNVPERPYKCSVCPSSTFSTQNNLKKHLATKHQHLQPPSQNHSGRSSASPRGSSDKGGSISSASSPRCATEERDVDDEEDEEGLVGAEDEEGVLDEEEEMMEEEEEGVDMEEEEEAAGDVPSNRETHNQRSSSSHRKKETIQSSVKGAERPDSEQSNRMHGRHSVNGNLHVLPSADEGEQEKVNEKTQMQAQQLHHSQPNNQVNGPSHQQQHHHHHHHHHHTGSDLPFKCHLCEHSYAERNDALNHIRDSHASEYELLVAKGALDSATALMSEDAHNNNHHGGTNNNISGAEQMGGEENLEQLRGKFPDYANRKVVCAFCMRRFWSAEDLRRHMRTHTGERPFSCDICARRFTLKHSMLRHRKKHSAAERASGVTGNPLGVATSEASDEEALTTRQRSSIAGDIGTNSNHVSWEKNLQLGKDDEGDGETKRRKLVSHEIARAAATAIGAGAAGAGDLIGNLLGIQDGSIIDKMLLSKSANDAAKLLGVEGHD